MAKFNLGIFSKYRSTIYGLSILWIAFFHSTVVIDNGLFSFLKIIKQYGDCGVDIFLFLSGISLYFAYKKHSTISEFYVRRLQRIVIPTLIVSIPWFIVVNYLKKEDLLFYFLNVTGLNLFIDGRRTIWFVTMIFICYLLYPLIYRFYIKLKWSPKALLIMLLCSFSINAVLRFGTPVFWDRTEILFCRFPVFIIGTYIGKYVYEKKELPLAEYQTAILSVILIIIAVLLKPVVSVYISERYLYIGLAFGFSVLMSMCGRNRIISNAAGFFAPVTLELYLVHEKIVRLFTEQLFPEGNMLLLNTLAFVLACLMAYSLSFICKKINRVFDKVR